MNGIINKKVEYIFDTIFDAALKTDVIEGTYSLIRNTGDIYIFNGSNWVTYKRRVLPNIITPKTQTNRYNLNIRPKNSSSYALSEDVEIFIGNYTVDMGIHNFSITEECSLAVFNSGSENYLVSMSLWENVSMSLS